MKTFPTAKIRNVALVGHGNSGKTTLASSLVLQLNDDTVVTTTGAILDVQAQITGTGLLTKAGAATLKLGNTANSWTGGTSITAGTIEIGDTTGFSGAVTVSSAVVTALRRHTTTTIKRITSKASDEKTINRLRWRGVIDPRRTCVFS